MVYCLKIRTHDVIFHQIFNPPNQFQMFIIREKVIVTQQFSQESEMKKDTI